MKIAIGCDHAGFQLKQILLAYLRERGHQLRDFGTDSEASVDYVDFVVPLTRAVVRGEFERGIFCCGSGIGPAVAACKIPGGRAAVVSEEWSARDGVEHVDVNVLTLGQRVIGPELAKSIVDAYLSAEPQGGRHERRREKIAALEKERVG
ncbi:MAG: ribose 5-phosphate isomerase B [Chloroflexi bacterium]|nr:MAG: ribose 5-phosphate isomerase B [Chloroflexota bacterium]